MISGPALGGSDPRNFQGNDFRGTGGPPGFDPRPGGVFPIVRRGTPFPGILQRAIPSADVAENPIPSITCSDADFLYYSYDFR